MCVNTFYEDYTSLHYFGIKEFLGAINIRLKLLLQADKSVTQDKENNSKFHIGTRGFIYAKIKSLEIHNDKCFKYFTFSNLFPLPSERIEENKNYWLTISSPREDIIEIIKCNCPIGEKINLGEYSFILKDIREESNFKLKDFSILRTATLINITKKTQNSYKSLLLENDKDFLYYLQNNGLAKYNYYFNEDNDFNLFENCKIEAFGKKSVSLKIYSEKGDYLIIGNLLDFKFGSLKKKQREILEFLIESGFGERTTYGLGYLYSNNANNNFENLKDFNVLAGEAVERN